MNLTSEEIKKKMLLSSTYGVLSGASKEERYRVINDHEYFVYDSQKYKYVCSCEDCLDAVNICNLLNNQHYSNIN